MLDIYETTIELPYSIMVELRKFVDATGMSPQEVIIQLLAIALSQEPQMQSAKVKSLLGLGSDDE